MALVLKDRVRETTTTTGTGTVTLAGAATGYQSFSAIGNANTTYYCIAGQGTNEWEVGIGTYTSSGTTLSRDTILASSNSNNAVDFSAGSKDVFVTYPAGKSVNYNASSVVNIGNLSLTANTLASTDTNGNVVVAPNGTGDVQLDADTVRIGDSNANATLTTNGTGDLVLSTNSGTNSGTITIADGVDGDITLDPNGAGKVIAAALLTVGTGAGEAEITSNGANDLTLHTNNKTNSGIIRIFNGANGNIELAPNGTGDVYLSSDTVRIGDSNTNATLTTNGTGDLILNTNSGTNSGAITIADGANGAISIETNGTGRVTVNSNAGIGTTTAAAANLLRLGDGNLSGDNQRGINLISTFTTASTTSAYGFLSNPSLAAGATYTIAVGYRAQDISKDAGDTLTTQVGFDTAALSTGTNIYAFRGQVASGTDKYNLYMSGTAQNYLAGNLGIGATAPATSLEIATDNTAGTALNILRFTDTDTTTAANQPLGKIEFYGSDTGNAGVVSYIEAAAQGATGGGDLRFGVSAVTATATEKARFTGVGNFKIGGTANRGTTEGTNQVVLFNGTAPAGTLTNGISFYSASGEARVMDAAGNSTLLSPHDKETNEWIYYSEHTPTGKRLRIDMEKMMRFLNDHFGLDFIHED